MELNFHVNGAERKHLVQIISDWLGVPAKYCGAPTFNYEVDYFTIDRNGSLSFDDRADSEVIERLSGVFNLGMVSKAGANDFWNTSTMRALTSTGATLMTGTSLAPSAFPCRRACSPTATWKT